DLLRALRTGDVLRRAADPACDVQVGGDLRARLPDLVGVRTPARARDDARAPDRRAEQACELLDDREALRRSDAAPAADHDLRVAQRYAAGRLLDGLEHLGRAVVGGVERLDVADLCRGLRVRRDGEELRRAVQPRLLEKAAAPAHARDRVAVERDDVRGEGLVE